MGGDVHKTILACPICHKAKSQLHQSLYNPLSVPLKPSDDVSTNFIVALLRAQRQKDVIMVVVDRSFKMAYFIPCHKTNDASYITELYFKKIIRLHGVPMSILSDKDSKIQSHFWRSLYKLLGLSLIHI